MLSCVLATDRSEDPTLRLWADQHQLPGAHRISTGRHRLPWLAVASVIAFSASWTRSVTVSASSTPPVAVSVISPFLQVSDRPAAAVTVAYEGGRPDNRVVVSWGDGATSAAVAIDRSASFAHGYVKRSARYLVHVDVVDSSCALARCSGLAIVVIQMLPYARR